KLFFFDTCYSGPLLGGKGETRANIDKFANELKASENGVVVFSACSGNQLSPEKDEWGHGAFAMAVLEGLKGGAARQGIDAISISDLESYVSRRVEELTNGLQRPTTAIPNTVEDFWIATRPQ